MRVRLAPWLCLMLLGCNGILFDTSKAVSGAPTSNEVGAPGAVAAPGGPAGGNAAGGSGGASGGSGVGATAGSGGTPDPGVPFVTGVPDTSVVTALPPVPGLVNVKTIVIGDTAHITFDPIDSARDYRVYTLPADSDISSTADGHVTVKNAIYRCGGDRQAPPANMDNAQANICDEARQICYGNLQTLVDGQDVLGYTRSLAEATLGYVYQTAGDGRVPIYAMGDPAANADNECPAQRWGASRSKRYVGEAEHATLLAQRWRDDGVVFYVPAAGASGTRQVWHIDENDPNHASVKFASFYYVDGPEAAARTQPHQGAFSVFTDASADTVPLMRVFYANPCGIKHDELAIGAAWFARLRSQGDAIPELELTWSGLTAATTLVVEALDAGCPFQGDFSPQSGPAETSGSSIAYPQLVTLAEMQASAATGEVFLNGQHDPSSTPRPMARTFVKVTAAAPPAYDWFHGFGADDSLGEFAPVTACPSNPINDNCSQTAQQQSSIFNMWFKRFERFAFGSTLGELWMVYSDQGADTGALMRLAADTKAIMSADSYLHVTMEVNATTTGRRYPQLLISDLDAPIQDFLPNGRTLVLETFANWPNTYELQVCDHRDWDVNSQCPRYDFYHVYDPADPTAVTALAPVPDIGERTAGIDRSVRFDLYASTSRAYVFLDGEPYGCANFPAAFSDGTHPQPPSGPVSITFGDVIYHSGVDSYTFGFQERYNQIEARRHFDNLGFKSGVSAPAWNEDLLPCTARTAL